MRLALCLTVLAACSPAPPVELAPGDAYDVAVNKLDADLAATRDRATGNDWTHAERLAGLHLERARLTGEYSDYDHALDALDEAFRIAPDGSGPHATQAAVLASLHRLDEAADANARAWQRPLLDDRTRARLTLLDGQLAWQGGDYLDGHATMVEAHALRDTTASHAALAHHAWHTTDFATADAGYLDALSDVPASDAHGRAWVELQRGILDLDRDHLDEAMEHFLAADATFPGWWLVHEHIAEVLTLTGREDQAEALYIDVIDRTGNPEFMDALGELRIARGDDGDELLARARTLHLDRVARHPEAAAGHALDHFIAHGSPDEAVELALANVAARPNAEAHMKLAQAVLVAGRASEADDAITAALQTPWRTAELYDIAAEVAEARGNRAEARAHREAARALRE